MVTVFGIGGDSAVRSVGREHFPVYPRGFFILRIAQLVVGVIVLGLDAYGLSYFSFTGDSLNMFTCIATLITCVYLLVAEFAAPAIFNYWAALGLDMLLVVFWLSSFALMASQVAPFLKSGEECIYGYCYTYGLYGSDKTFGDSMAAVAGLGGLEFLLFVITLVVSGLALHRHRSFGLHCMPGQARTVAGDAGEKGVPVVMESAQPMQPLQPIQQQQAAAAAYSQQQQAAAAYSQQTFTPPPPSSTPGSVPQQAYFPPQQVQQVQQVQAVHPAPGTYYEAQA